MRRKIIAAALALLLLTLTAGCSAKGGSTYEEGLRLCKMVGEIAGDSEYISSFYSESSQDVYGGVYDIAENIADGRYDRPEKVYSIDFPDISDLISSLGEDEVPRNYRRWIRSLPDEDYDLLNIRFATSAISSINSGLETAAVSLSSVCSIGESYVDRDLEGLEIYIYSFRDGVPIAVFFIPGEDGAASASAVPLLSQELDTSTERRLENSLEEFFSPLDRFDVSKIDIP